MWETLHSKTDKNLKSPWMSCARKGCLFWVHATCANIYTIKTRSKASGHWESELRNIFFFAENTDQSVDFLFWGDFLFFFFFVLLALNSMYTMYWVYTLRPDPIVFFCQDHVGP